MGGTDSHAGIPFTRSTLRRSSPRCARLPLRSGNAIAVFPLLGWRYK